MFFFEKKNQKTFSPVLAWPRWSFWAGWLVGEVICCFLEDKRSFQMQVVGWQLDLLGERWPARLNRTDGRPALG